MVILSVSYVFLSFRVVSVEDNFKIGYVPVGIVSFYVLLNLLGILGKIYSVLRRKYLIRRALKGFRK